MKPEDRQEWVEKQITAYREADEKGEKEVLNGLLEDIGKTTAAVKEFGMSTAAFEKVTEKISGLKEAGKGGGSKEVGKEVYVSVVLESLMEQERCVKRRKSIMEVKLDSPLDVDCECGPPIRRDDDMLEKTSRLRPSSNNCLPALHLLLSGSAMLICTKPFCARERSCARSLDMHGSSYIPRMRCFHLISLNINSSEHSQSVGSGHPSYPLSAVGDPLENSLPNAECWAPRRLVD